MSQRVRTAPDRRRSPGRGPAPRSRPVAPRGRAPQPTTRRPLDPRPPARVRRPVEQPRRGGSDRTAIAALSRGRIATLAIAFTLACGLLVGRLVQLQVVDPARYVERGEQQRLRTIELAADRGSIVDRDGDILAISVPARTVAADPRYVEDPVNTATRLAEVLPEGSVDVDTLARRLDDPERRFVYVARQLDADVAEQVEFMRLPGVFVIDEPRREYPGSPVADGILGRTDPDGRGTAGLDRQYDRSLTGRPGSLSLERSQRGDTIAVGQHELRPARPGEDLVLTIDRQLQFQVEDLVTRAVDRTVARSGMAMVADPKTGDVLAVANIARDEDGRLQPSSYNMSSVFTFEPGSVMKPVTLASALDDQLVGGTEILDVPTRVSFNGATYADYGRTDTAQMPLAQIMAQSSNVGTTMIADRFTNERFAERLRAFGFGGASGLRFPGETKGLVLPADEWYGTTRYHYALGQSLTVTAAQLTQAYATIANDGVAVPLRLVGGRIGEDGRQVAIAPGDGRRVVSANTARITRTMLRGVVTEGTGRRAAIPGYAVGGKTGTAPQLLDDGTYGETGVRRDYVASFAGLLPANDPQYVIVVVINRPTQGRMAADVAAPLFSEVATAVARWAGLSPSVEPPDEATATTSTTAGKVRADPAVDPASTTTTLPGAPAATGTAGTGTAGTGTDDVGTDASTTTLGDGTTG